MTQQDKCAYDTDGDGNCQHCHNRGGCRAIGGPFEYTMHDAMGKMMAGEITSDAMADLVQKVCGVKPEPQFDQLERRLLFGYPIIEKDSNAQEHEAE